MVKLRASILSCLLVGVCAAAGLGGDHQARGVPGPPCPRQVLANLSTSSSYLSTECHLQGDLHGKPNVSERILRRTRREEDFEVVLRRLEREEREQHQSSSYGYAVFFIACGVTFPIAVFSMAFLIFGEELDSLSKENRKRLLLTDSGVGKEPPKQSYVRVPSLEEMERYMWLARDEEAAHASHRDAR